MTGSMQRRSRRTPVAAVAVAAMAGLSGCALPFTTPTVAPSIPPTPLPAAPSSAAPLLVPTGPAPALANTGANWGPLVASLLTYGQWLLANPGTGTVSTIAAAGCPLTGGLTTDVASLSGEGWRLAPAPLTISSLGAPARLAPGQNTVTLLLKASRGAEAVVDSAGHATSGEAALAPTAFDVTVVLGGDGKWRLCSADPLPGSAMAASSVPALF